MAFFKAVYDRRTEKSGAVIQQFFIIRAVFVRFGDFPDSGCVICICLVCDEDMYVFQKRMSVMTVRICAYAHTFSEKDFSKKILFLPKKIFPKKVCCILLRY